MTEMQWLVAIIWIMGIAVEFQYELGWIDPDDESAQEERDRLFSGHVTFLFFGLLNIFVNEHLIRFTGAVYSLFLFAFVMYTVVDSFTEYSEEEDREEQGEEEIENYGHGGGGGKSSRS